MKYDLVSLIICWLYFLVFPLSVQSQGERHYTCYKTDHPLVMDGLLNENEWALASWSGDFVDITGDPQQQPALQTRMKMLWDEHYLYVAAELIEPHLWARLRQRDTVVFHDNDFEIFIDPDGNGLNYYEIEVNALGTVWDLLLTKAYKNFGRPVSSWNLDGIKIGIRAIGTLNDPSNTDTSWMVEMALPISVMMKGKDPSSSPAKGVQWRMNFSRVEWKTEVRGSSYHKLINPATGKPLPEQNWVWSPMGETSMHIPECWGYLEFSSAETRRPQLSSNHEQQKQDWKISVWMGNHASKKGDLWDSLFNEFHSSGISGILTQADPSTLQRMIAPAIRNGITIEKWFVTLMNNDSALIHDHPGWFVINRDGKSSITNPAYVGYYRFLCPSNPEVREYLKSALDQYLRIPGLDGIHLDYIRYPDVILPQALWTTYGIVQDREYAPYDYCYCEICREKFKTVNGVDPITMVHPEKSEAWRQFRYDEITALVKELADHCHKAGKKISAAVFPGPSIAKQLVRQEWDLWPVDAVYPMLYQRFYHGDLDWIRQKTSEGVQSLENKIPLNSGLYIPDLTPSDLYTAIQKSIAGGASGICLFNYESMTESHWEILKKLPGK